MNRAPLVLAFALVAVPAFAADKDKDKKPPETPARPSAVSAEDLARQAEEKIAAGDIAAATALLQKATALAGTSGETKAKLGQLLESTRDVEAAMESYQAAAAVLTGAAKGDALGRLAVLQEIRGMAAFAETAQAAAAADPEGPWACIALARLRAREGKGDEALALAQKAAAAPGAGPAAQAAIGRAQEAREDWAAAEAAYRAAGAAEGRDVPGTVGLARVLRRTGRAAEAAPLLEKVIAAYPGAAEAYKESARVKIALGLSAEAFGDAYTAAALAEGDPDAKRVVEEAAVAKALAQVARNEADLAIQDLSALRDRHPDSALVRVGLGRALAARRQADAAVVELTKAAELEPGLADAHFHLGYVQQMHKRDAAAAVSAYEKALAADPTNVEYRTSLGAALIDARLPARAATELARVTSAPGYAKPEAWALLGAAHLAAKHYKDAVPPLQKAAALAPQDAQVEAYLAWAYFGLKDSARFKAHGAKARTLGHKEPTLLQYLTRIEAGEPIK